MPLTPCRIAASGSSTGSGTDVLSRGSLPATATYAAAASSTVCANGPTWSRDDAKAISPYRDTRPYVGLNPTTPHRDAGWRMDPPVSVP